MSGLVAMSSQFQTNRRYVSPVQVARALGVSESTVKRWVDTNRLAAHRTVGGHRRILVQDVVELVRREKLPHLELTALQEADPLSISELAEEFQGALLAGNSDEVRYLILDAHQAGHSISTLADQVISPVMACVGHGWFSGEVDIYHEHRATQLCLSPLLALEARIQAAHPVTDDTPLALGGGPEGDHYILANLLVAMALREIGWRVQNIGPNTPFDSLRRAMTDLRPRLVWLSCSHIADVQSFLHEYEAFYKHAERARVAVAVGGRAIDEPLRRRMTFTHFGDHIGHLTAYASQLLALRS